MSRSHYVILRHPRRPLSESSVSRCDTGDQGACHDLVSLSCARPASASARLLARSTGDFSAPVRSPVRDPIPALERLGVASLRFGPEVQDHEMLSVTQGILACLEDLDTVLREHGVDVSLGKSLAFAYRVPDMEFFSRELGAYRLDSREIFLRKVRTFAHEWCHALEAAHGTLNAGTGGFSTDDPSSPFHQAFEAIGLHTGMVSRALALDDGVRTPYLSLPREIMARTFSSWVGKRLRDHRIKNSHLSGWRSQSWKTERIRIFAIHPLASEDAAIAAIMRTLMKAVSSEGLRRS